MASSVWACAGVATPAPSAIATRAARKRTFFIDCWVFAVMTIFDTGGRRRGAAEQQHGQIVGELRVAGVALDRVHDCGADGGDRVLAVGAERRFQAGLVERAAAVV